MRTNSTSLPQQYSIFKKMSFIKFFITFAVLASHVLAGSRIWQPQVLAKFDRGASTSPLERRYFIINEESKISERIRWKNRQIRYCYETEEAKTILDRHVQEAFKVWIDNGLNDFSMVPAGEVECRENPYTVLHIIYTTGTLSTFVGFPRDDNDILKGTQGKLSMRLSDRTDIGNLDKVSNYAHEIGHALGLFHEHQNPAFWSNVNAAKGGSGSEFDGNTFNCANLNDYERTEIVADRDMVLMSQLCRNRGMSSDYGFSASEFLPLDSQYGTAHGPNIDWDSIMIYHSGVGGRIDASIPGNDQRMPVLLKNDGSRIGINLEPSTQDIAGVDRLYEKEPASSREVLHQKGSTSAMRKFMERFNLSKKKGGKGGGSSGCL
ncbi:hypothetical protein V492_08508 [Pseudogymnoascus sp. VKM F-4246]|nr:hypothetical protein V492_08508 [Pseudogymnoascus sp. VKM F-4246]